mmetsp:Transcript_82390/g.183973  ORF Transcript_82390/g.183973 Transcript_82390/m.183973 type:complete len:232 (-) Transcript_82390:14-709(-)
MASTSRMLLRNLFPKPSPFEAPFTNPAMSTYSICSGMTFSELAVSASSFNRTSGTVARATFGSMVQKGKFAASAFPFSHRALKSVLLPTLGRPTMPVFRPLSCVRLSVLSGWLRRFRAPTVSSAASAAEAPATSGAAVWKGLAMDETPEEASTGSCSSALAPLRLSVDRPLAVGRKRVDKEVKAGNPRCHATTPTKPHSKAWTALRRTEVFCPRGAMAVRCPAQPMPALFT